MTLIGQVQIGSYHVSTQLQYSKSTHYLQLTTSGNAAVLRCISAILTHITPWPLFGSTGVSTEVVTAMQFWVFLAEERELGLVPSFASGLFLGDVQHASVVITPFQEAVVICNAKCIGLRGAQERVK